MKVTKNQIDALNIELIINVDAADYAEAERKKLAECRRKADFKGFRKGMVPEGMIRKVYGEQILADSVNDVLSEQLNKFIEDEKLNILGEPLSSEKQQPIEWKSGNSFEFIFDIATSPVVEFEVSAEDTVNKYSITVSEKEKTEMAENLKKYYESRKDEEAEPKTDEQIAKEVEERFKENNKQEAEYRLTQDIRKFYVEKSGIQLPEDFLKRWLFVANQGKVSKEEIEKEFPGFVEDFKWQMVRGYLMKKYDFKIEQADLEEAAKAYVTYQYAMYGISNLPEDILADAIKNMLSDSKQIERLAESVEDQKVIAKLKETITVKSKKISSEKFRAL